MIHVASVAPQIQPPAPSASGTARPVRVLIACDHIDHDGALHGGGRQLIELVQALDPARVEPTVCILRGASSLGRELQAEGLPFSFFGDSRFSPATIGKLVTLIRQRGIDVLHLTDFGASTFGRLAGWITRIPAIVQVISHHSEYQPRGFPWYVELAYRAQARFTAKALAISESVRRFSIERMGFAEEQVEVLYYPLPKHSFAAPTADEVEDLRKHHGIAPGDPIVGAVTRFFPVKGMRYLIQAFADVRAAEPRAWLILVGRGPEEEDLRAQCRARGIADRVLFAGFQRAVEAYVTLFDVSVVPSLEEGFGLVALESMALGTPVIASRIDGLQEIIADGSSGLLVAPADPQAIAAAILKLVGDAELSQRLSDRGRMEAQRFSVDHYADRLTELYRQVAVVRAPSTRL